MILAPKLSLKFLLILFAAAWMVAPAGALAAPPQILGLVATATPTPLSCENGKCWAEFSAFCLQKHRQAPDEKTAYLAGRRYQTDPPADRCRRQRSFP
jgi:hypothetical protein